MSDSKRRKSGATAEQNTAAATNGNQEAQHETNLHKKIRRPCASTIIKCC